MKLFITLLLCALFTGCAAMIPKQQTPTETTIAADCKDSVPVVKMLDDIGCEVQSFECSKRTLKVSCK